MRGTPTRQQSGRLPARAREPRRSDSWRSKRAPPRSPLANRCRRNCEGLAMKGSSRSESHHEDADRQVHQLGRHGRSWPGESNHLKVGPAIEPPNEPGNPTPRQRTVAVSPLGWPAPPRPRRTQTRLPVTWQGISSGAWSRPSLRLQLQSNTLPAVDARFHHPNRD